MLRLVDNIENKSYQGTTATIKKLLYILYNQYSKEEILKGVAFIKDTWYIG